MLYNKDIMTERMFAQNDYFLIQNANFSIV